MRNQERKRRKKMKMRAARRKRRNPPPKLQKTIVTMKTLTGLRTKVALMKKSLTKMRRPKHSVLKREERNG